MASVEFKSFSESTQRMIVGQAAKLYDAGYSVIEIAEYLHISIELTNEIVEMIQKAKAFKEGESN
jgi:transposase-like protein